MDTFVREAIARAAFERREEGGEGRGGHFLEVGGSVYICLFVGMEGGRV